jgi:hypothetical protein
MANRVSCGGHRIQLSLALSSARKNNPITAKTNLTGTLLKLEVKVEVPALQKAFIRQKGFNEPSSDGGLDAPLPQTTTNKVLAQQRRDQRRADQQEVI